MYPDKRLFGKEPGEALNEHFYARSWVNTALVGYPELEPVLGVDPSELQEIDNIFGPLAKYGRKHHNRPVIEKPPTDSNGLWEVSFGVIWCCPRSSVMLSEERPLMHYKKGSFTTSAFSARSRTMTVRVLPTTAYSLGT